MLYEDNPYYHPEKSGLKILWQIDTGGSYEFDMFVVWQHQDGTLWYDSDAGCSCPTPFEDAKLKALTNDTFWNFQQALKNHRDITIDDRNECETMVKVRLDQLLN